MLAAATSAGAAEIPPEAKAREARLLAKASPAVKTWVRDEGQRVAKAGDVNREAVAAAVRARFGSQTFVLGNMADADIEAIAFLVLMQAAKSAQEDLKSIMDQTKKINEQKAQQHAANEKVREIQTQSRQARPDVTVQAQARKATDKAAASMSDVSETESLRLQMAMDRRSKFMETLSNLLKKQSETSSQIIQNLK